MVWKIGAGFSHKRGGCAPVILFAEACLSSLALDSSQSLAGMTTYRGVGDLENISAALRGGIPGSALVWGDYSRFEYPN